MPIFSKTRHFKRHQTVIFFLAAFFFIVIAACAPAATPVPTPLPTLVASLTPSTAPDISVAVDATLTALAPIGPTPTDITLTPTPETTADPNATVDPNATITPIVVTLPALAGHQIEPPLDITLPEGWQVVLTDVQVLPDVDNEILAAFRLRFIMGR